MKTGKEGKKYWRWDITTTNTRTHTRMHNSITRKYTHARTHLRELTGWAKLLVQIKSFFIGPFFSRKPLPTPLPIDAAFLLSSFHCEWNKQASQCLIIANLKKTISQGRGRWQQLGAPWDFLLKKISYTHDCCVIRPVDAGKLVKQKNGRR